MLRVTCPSPVRVLPLALGATISRGPPDPSFFPCITRFIRALGLSGAYG